MGRDKALLELGSGRLMDAPLAALDAVCQEVLLATGVRSRYGELGRPVVLDAVPDGGPLAGLAAGLEAARGRGARWVPVLACDLPRADGAILARLLERAQAKDMDACLLGLERGSQPTYAVYHTRVLPALSSSLAAGERRLVSWHSARLDGRSLRVGTLDALGAEGLTARNVNTPEDLERERMETNP